MSSINLGSIGEIPPSTIFSSGLTVRMAEAASTTISENLRQSGSRWKSQCERLLGSFHSITASTMQVLSFLFLSCEFSSKFQVHDITPIAMGGLRLADPGLMLRMRDDSQACAPQHGFGGAPVRDPPI